MPKCPWLFENWELFNIKVLSLLLMIRAASDTLLFVNVKLTNIASTFWSLSMFIKIPVLLMNWLESNCIEVM